MDVDDFAFGALILCAVFLLVALTAGLGSEYTNRVSYQSGTRTQSTLSLNVEGCQQHVKLQASADSISEGFWLAGCYDSIGK